jgi:hypothetical protein
MVVLNLGQVDKKGEDRFLARLDNLRTTLETDVDDLSQPQLIILRRDSNSKEFKEKDFLRKVEEYALFNSDIVTMNMVTSLLRRLTPELPPLPPKISEMWEKTC